MLLIMDSTDKVRCKKRQCKLKDQPESSLECLPHDLVLKILSRLPISSLMRLKLVCRTWRNLVQDADLANMHFSHMAKSNPCLIFYSDYAIQNQLYFDEFYASNEKEPVKKVCLPCLTEMPKFDLIGSCDGLLCFCDSQHVNALFVCNPFTRDYLELPKSTIQDMNQRVIFGFGSHPTKKEYKVVRIAYNNVCRPPGSRGPAATQAEVQVLTLGSPIWRSIGNLAYQFANWPSQVLLNGRLHWVTLPFKYGPGRLLVSFDLADEQFREVPKPAGGAFDGFRYHAVVLGGCLSVAVFRYFAQLDVWVMKDYGVKDSWFKKTRISTYLPKELDQDLHSNFKIPEAYINGAFVKVLCLLKNGEILLEYKNRALVSYNPTSGIFKDIRIQGLPGWFATSVHAGSLISLDALVNI